MTMISYGISQAAFCTDDDVVKTSRAMCDCFEVAWHMNVSMR